MKRIPPALLLCASLLCFAVHVTAQVMISEFVAENAASATDEDGDHPDWIELLNTTAQAVNLDGWFLSDDLANPVKWRVPAVTLPGRGYLVVFASGKNRAVPGTPLHTNFSLNPDGESLLLVQPDGVTVASSFVNFPRQREDIGFGVSREVLAGPLLTQGSPVRAHVPVNGNLGTIWTGGNEPFDDAAWQSGTAGAGYDLAPPSAGGLVAFWDFNDASVATQALDASGSARHGTVEGGAAFTPDAGGRTGGAGDRAMNFGNIGSARVRIASAATGAFNALTSANACTISVWMFGDASQPGQDSLFYASPLADGSGERSLNAHVPWSDSVIYWDTGGADGNTRISVGEPSPTKWKGQWNHYVFVKNGATKQIWQNGALLAEGQNSTVVPAIRSFWIGFAPWGPYGGKVDDFAVWSRSLGAAEIGQLAAGASPRSLLGFGSLIGMDLSGMRGVNATAYVRERFTMSSTDYDSLELRVKYDDGFVAYLNGAEIARRNAPDALAWNSSAVADRPRIAALSYERIELPGSAAQLAAGANILAIQALNDTASSDELLILPELVKVRTASPRYLLTPTPNAPNGAGVLDFVAEPTISVARGYYTAPFETAIACTTPGATLVYTLDGSEPTLTNGTKILPPDVATAPSGTVSISTTRALRVAAFKDALQPSRTTTATYLFAAQIATQPASIPGWPATWNGGFRGDYQMDPDVVNTTQPGYGIGEALASLPSVSVVGKLSEIVNLYNNSTARDLEIGVSAEWIDPADAAAGWQEDCGILVHGNISRQKDFTPKHGFRLNFSAVRGARSLKEQVFPTTNVDRFDQIVLKSLSTDTWPVVEWGTVIDGDLRWQRAEAAYICDQFFRDSQRALGQISAHGRFAHLFLNGVYWGLINVLERPSQDFCAKHLGGEPEDWDVMKDFNELEAGARAPWDQLLALAGSNGFGNEATYQRAQGNNPDGTRNPAFPVLLNVPSLIDYMILHIASGSDDWPDHNWYSARRRTADSEGFLFFAWDQEISNNSVQKQSTSWGTRYEFVAASGTPAQLYNSARQNARFKRQFADRVQQVFFNNGPLTQAAMVARWDGLEATIDKAIVAESARWGDYQRAMPYKREVEWLTHMNWMTSTYWPQFGTRALIRFRNAGIFPNTGAPVFSQHGGAVPAGFTLTITKPGNGELYYTTNGTDPATAGAPLYTDPIPINSLVKVRARVKNGTEWSAATDAVFQPEQNFPALVVTEICFDPPANGPVPGEELEFIELQNTGATALDLSRVTFTAGLGFTFADGTSLSPGALVVIAKNPAQCTARHGGNALGPFSGQLDNSGEMLTLTDALGRTIFSFAYGVGPLWPAMNGGSLHYLGAGPPVLASSWFAFRATPGVNATDADGDGASNVAEWLAGTNAGDAASMLRIVSLVLQPNGSYTGTFNAVGGRRYSVLVSPDLAQWTPLPADLTAATTGPLEFTDPNPPAGQRFYRVVTPAQP